MLYHTHLSNFISASESYLSSLAPLPSTLDMNMLMISSCTVLLECSLVRLLRTAVCEGASHHTVQRRLSEKLSVQHNPHYLRFNMYNLHFQEFLTYIKNVAANSHVIPNKIHVLVLNHVETLNHTQQHTLAKVFERSRNVRLILPTTQQGGISERFANQFAVIRIPTLDDALLEQSFRAYCAEREMEEHQDTFRHCDADLEMALKALCFPADLLRESPLFDPLDREIQGVLEGARKSVLCSKILLATRQSIYKIMKYNISHTDICRAILRAILKKHRKKHQIAHAMIAEVARTEHQLIMSSKPVFYYEKLILSYMQACASC